MELRDLFVERDVPAWVYDSLSKFAKDPPLQVNCAYATRAFVQRQYEPAILKTMAVKTLPLAGNFLGTNPSNYDCADFTCDTMIECTYKKGNKSRMANFKMGPKIVAVLRHFAKPENWNKPLVDKCLQVLGNLTYEASNNMLIADQGIVFGMLDALSTSEFQIKTASLVLGCTGNMSYEYNPTVLAKITNDGAIKIYADCLKHFDATGDLEMFVLTSDGLANIAHNAEICVIIRKFDLIGYILRTLKGNQDNARVCYKLTRCLYRLCSDEGIRQQVIDRNGHEVIIETTDNLFEDPGTCLNCLRLMNCLAAVKDDVLFEDIFQAGIPKVVIEKYRLPDETEEEIGEGGAKTPGSAKSFKSKVSGMSRLPTEPPESGPGWTGGLGKPHVSECLKLLRKMAHHEAASLMTGATFGVAMFETMNNQIDGRDIQIAVQDLCRDLLDRDENNEPLYYAEGIPALKNVLERWDFDPAVAIKVIFFP